MNWQSQSLQLPAANSLTLPSRVKLVVRSLFRWVCLPIFLAILGLRPPTRDSESDMREQNSSAMLLYRWMACFNPWH